MNSEEGNLFSVGEKVDLDNDGENELVINGPYGAVWIMYSNRSSAGFEFYHIENFEGTDNLAAEMNFGEELTDPENAEAGIKYSKIGTPLLAARSLIGTGETANSQCEEKRNEKKRRVENHHKYIMGGIIVKFSIFLSGS